MQMTIKGPRPEILRAFPEDPTKVKDPARLEYERKRKEIVKRIEALEAEIKKIEAEEKLNAQIEEVIAELTPAEQREIIGNKKKETEKIDFPFIKRKLAETVSNIGERANNVWKKIADKLLKKGVLIAGIYFTASGSAPAIAGVETPTPLKEVPGIELPAPDIKPSFPVKTLTESLEAAPFIADQGAYEQLSPNGKRVYEFNIGKNVAYVIADKENAEVIIFGKDNKLIKKSPAIFGAAIGEAPNTADEQTEIPGPGATTPMGSYTLTRTNIHQDDIKTYQGNIFGVYEDPKMGLHMTYPGELSERTKALESATPSDNFLSWGCINVPKDFMIEFVIPNIGERAKLYVLPKDRDQEFYPK